jgi:hypothetical protein
MNRQEISREQLAGCWKRLDGGGYWELRDDGTARHKLTGRGGSCDVAREISWTYIAPGGFEIEFAAVTDELGGCEADVSEYQVKYFDGKLLELWHLRHNDSVVENIMLTQPVCWKKSRPPKSWRTD